FGPSDGRFRSRGARQALLARLGRRFRQVDGFVDVQSGEIRGCRMLRLRRRPPASGRGGHRRQTRPTRSIAEPDDDESPAKREGISCAQLLPLKTVPSLQSPTRVPPFHRPTSWPWTGWRLNSMFPALTAIRVE